MFFKAKGGSALHLRAYQKSTLTTRLMLEFKFCGWLMFTLMLNSVRVIRPFLCATMTYAYAKIPQQESGRALDASEIEFAIFCSSIHALLKGLDVEGVEVQAEAQRLIFGEDCGDIALKIMQLQPRPGFEDALRTI